MYSNMRLAERIIRYQNSHDLGIQNYSVIKQLNHIGLNICGLVSGFEQQENQIKKQIVQSRSKETCSDSTDSNATELNSQQPTRCIVAYVSTAKTVE